METRAPTTRRRHGSDLEGDILDAAWRQILEQGLDSLTFESVAARARTSRPVLYRRWPTREELAAAALRRQLSAHNPSLPDTGSLRGDVIALLHEALDSKISVASLVAAMGVFPERHPTRFATLRDQVLAHGTPVMTILLSRERERGELPVDIPKCVADLPLRLLRDEILIAGRHVDDNAITSIVDDIFLPLIRAYQHGLHYGGNTMSSPEAGTHQADIRMDSSLQSENRTRS
ncbi:MAG: TetR/AcrR family transcriptional regulator [Bifidobacterium tibiigranuli]|jgi:AcrR family transcriptional regulator|uniref:TetR/AcrR family transcriptional regulator n=1 Tax=Bifidobacterium tibiigranuli TaxID=2172043 RepID=UPI0023547C73|nr:TetR/AcrR family transcriptional regulator [Bifidobacterium tibiigranuli]MCH3974343.1 TetR/AcrR family transcriptional regulator [Bifidobacterium tibiigranuli]MCH4188906.1 TetR/AcrR family transcriptional regulator [Bifidobacterium tibiigranuli]MCH4203189.1 TetR/AcrR family transcriptional regulator [Bifidobacterium tibiigranuli]MCH4273422.1 TetR/AcrR family transcriptional regulator [Bifidobacterium tibiigranuli]MCI1253665.1 TetR/AcrR family transcriptional regulator [Bifidobacterium tibii